MTVGEVCEVSKDYSKRKRYNGNGHLVMPRKSLWTEVEMVSVYWTLHEAKRILIPLYVKGEAEPPAPYGALMGVLTSGTPGFMAESVVTVGGECPCKRLVHVDS